jgi:glycosyltransferase involved in cell wall biosynthesis
MIAVGSGSTGAELFALFDSALHGDDAFIVLHSGDEPPPEIVATLVRALDAPLAATASPVPVETKGDAPTRYEIDDRLPPPPTVPLPCVSLSAWSVEALRSVGVRASATTGAPDSAVVELGSALFRHGWRHVAAPGVAWPWANHGREVTRSGGWTGETMQHLAGPSNVSLETHRVWARSRTRPVHIAIDGACLSPDPHTGTQVVVLEIARWLHLTRPEARVELAVPQASVPAVRNEFVGLDIDVVARDRRSRSDDRCDVVYRPYQLLDARELAWMLARGRRLVVSQLDMIGASNPSYHPAPDMFFGARNLQRWLMRHADGVTFISEFGLASTTSEVVDLDPRRLTVVSCGADVTRPDRVTAPALALPSERFVLCLSATFWHKNRCHAIRVFAEMARNGYDGGLVIAGPEPYYGSSVEEENSILVGLGAVSTRVVRIGRVAEAEKWWLLARADVVLYPSVVEGFGLVPFEAAAAGTPCVAMRSTALAEVLGDAPSQMTTWDVGRWADRAHRLARDDAAASSAVDHIIGVATTFTWERCAQRTWTALDAVLAGAPARADVDEGGPLVRVSLPDVPTPAVAGRFFVNRVRAALARRVARRLGR